MLGVAPSDRYDPRKIMIASSAVRAALVAVLATLVWTDAVQMWHLYLLGAGFGAADAFYQPAALAWCRDWCPRIGSRHRTPSSWGAWR